MSMYKSREPDQSTWPGWVHSFFYVKTPSDIIASCQKYMRQAEREIDRYIMRSEREEEKQKRILKNKAKNPTDRTELKSIALLIANERRSRVSYRRQKYFIGKARSLLVDIKIKANSTLVFNNVTNIMSILNKTISIGGMQRIQHRFQYANAQFDAKQEICEEMLFGDDDPFDEEQEGEELVSDILKEAGVVEDEDRFPKIPKEKPSKTQQQQEEDALEELERELENFLKT